MAASSKLISLVEGIIWTKPCQLDIAPCKTVRTGYRLNCRANQLAERQNFILFVFQREHRTKGYSVKDTIEGFRFQHKSGISDISVQNLHGGFQKVSAKNKAASSGN